MGQRRREMACAGGRRPGCPRDARAECGRGRRARGDPAASGGGRRGRAGWERAYRTDGMTNRPCVVMVANRDSFLLSHRSPLARGARDAGMEVVVAAGDTGGGRAIQQAGFEFIPLPVTRGVLNPLSEARTFAFLLQLYRRQQPLLIHHSTVQPVIYGSVAARLVCDAVLVHTIIALGYVFTSEHRAPNALPPLLYPFS